MKNKYTPLSISKKLVEMGIEVESENYWYQVYGGHFAFGDTEEMMNNAVDMGRMTAPQFVSFPAYTIADLPKVLKQVWKKNGLPDIVGYNEYIPLWQYHFLEICLLYADSPEVAWDYLEDILK